MARILLYFVMIISSDRVPNVGVRAVSTEEQETAITYNLQLTRLVDSRERRRPDGQFRARYDEGMRDAEIR